MQFATTIFVADYQTNLVRDMLYLLNWWKHGLRDTFVREIIPSKFAGKIPDNSFKKFVFRVSRLSC